MISKKNIPLTITQKHNAEKKELNEIILKKSEELSVAIKEIASYNDEKEKRAAQLIITNIEQVLQSEEKGKRAAELVIANVELAFQNDEKGKRAAELLIANIELAFQNEEKRKRAAELVIANIELAFQNKEKSKRATELAIANVALAFQIKEKGLRASELLNVHKEYNLQNEEKDKKAFDLQLVNKELEEFAYIASHDLQQPLRTVSNYMGLFEKKYLNQLDDDAQKYLDTVKNATKRMSILIKSLLTFSQVGHNKKLVSVNCTELINEVLGDLASLIKETNAKIEVGIMPSLNVYDSEMRQLFQNLITNAIKFQKKNTIPKIKISSKKVTDKWEFCINDNGIGINQIYFHKIFDIFERLHGNSEYEGSGIGLANCKKIVQLHNGEIWLESNPGQGTSFYFTIPILT
ncbi:MAG: two-component sensor histidine kinase [Bacteroidia bacterium]|nr:two-component sensor histidine kinase [Bacteroidia bacterium]